MKLLAVEKVRRINSGADEKMYFIRDAASLRPLWMGCAADAVETAWVQPDPAAPGDAVPADGFELYRIFTVEPERKAHEDRD